MAGMKRESRGIHHHPDPPLWASHVPSSSGSNYPSCDILSPTVSIGQWKTIVITTSGEARVDSPANTIGGCWRKSQTMDSTLAMMWIPLQCSIVCLHSNSISLNTVAMVINSHVCNYKIPEMVLINTWRWMLLGRGIGRIQPRSVSQRLNKHEYDSC